MVQRARERSKRPASPTKERPAAGAAGAARGETRVRALEQECDRLKAELVEARQRIAALEESRSAVASRIDWVIESLNGVVERGD